ncbi:MAG: zinc ribbon domain-containing protein [Burkholderiaceae bacterium]|nr:MAG: zinc ribbon domain-containing protein [Burkholderiaceae bacterium]
MFCSKCGTENAEGARFCASCGTALAVAPTAAAPAPAPAVVRGAEPVAAASPAGPTGKTPWVAVLLSALITGAGQLYNNDWKKGLVMFFGAVLGFMFTGGIATLVIWIWSMVDGFQVASGKGKVW